jgi:hypothetical protein
MSITAASAENTMKILEFKINDNNNDNDNTNSKCENENKIFFKSNLNDSDDDDMVVIILEEDAHNNEVEKTESYEDEKEDGNSDDDDCGGDNVAADGNDADNGGVCANVDIEQQQQQQQQEKNANVSPPKKKYMGIEVYTHLQQTLESQKMYPLLPCNMISSFARVMEFVEYFDIPSEERKKLVVDLVKMLAYSNNDYGSRDCFEYFVEHNMIDDIIKTIVDSTKNRYDINRFPHTNRKIVLSCVSLSNKIKIVKPSAKIESIFEDFKLNLCGLKRFFKMKEKEESKQT